MGAFHTSLRHSVRTPEGAESYRAAVGTDESVTTSRDVAMHIVCTHDESQRITSSRMPAVDHSGDQPAPLVWRGLGWAFGRGKA